MQIERDSILLQYAELFSWLEVALNMLTLKAYGHGFIQTPSYPDRINQKRDEWNRLTKQCGMPKVARDVVLDNIEYGAKLGFELEPPNAHVPDKPWKDPVAWNAAAVATIKAIEHGIINTRPSSVKRTNKYFVVDSSQSYTPYAPIFTLCFYQNSCLRLCQKKPDPDKPTVR